MQSVATSLQGNFWFKKIEYIIYIYKETREKADELFQFVYTKAVSWAKLIWYLREMFGIKWTAGKLE